VCISRLIEESDLQNAKELFGNARASSASALDSFEPKSLKDHEELARLIAQQYLLPHSKNQHYKTLLKALLKQACVPVALPEVKDLETCIAGIKSDKIKEDKAAKEAKKGKQYGCPLMGSCPVEFTRTCLDGFPDDSRLTLLDVCCSGGQEEECQCWLQGRISWPG